jgi:hypothetical protein
MIINCVYVSSDQLSVIERIAEGDLSFMWGEGREVVELSLLCMGILNGGANVQLVTLPKVDDSKGLEYYGDNIIPFPGSEILFEGVTR